MSLIKKYKYIIITLITALILFLVIYNYATRQSVAFGMDNTGQPVIYIPSCNKDIQLTEVEIKSYRSSGIKIEESTFYDFKKHTISDGILIKSSEMPKFAMTSFSQTLIKTDKDQYWNLKVKVKGSSVWSGSITYKRINNLTDDIFIYENEKLTQNQIDKKCSQHAQQKRTIIF